MKIGRLASTIALASHRIVKELWIFLTPIYRKRVAQSPTRRSTINLLEGYINKNLIWNTGFELLPYAMYEPQLVSYDSVRDLVQKAFNQIIQGKNVNIKDILDRLTEKANLLQNKQSD